MALNGIDVASYQAGLDPAKVPCDFAIVKATQGTNYINPDFHRMADAVLMAGKLLGIYHYASGGDPIAEADHFLHVTEPYIGKATLWLDWESDQNPSFGKTDTVWCNGFLTHIKKKTGVACGIYMSKSVCHAHNWAEIAKDHPLWCAQYANNNPTGYQSDPWTDSSSFCAWSEAVVYQYSSHGRLANWNANLDIDIAYMSRGEWMALAKGTPVSVPSSGVIHSSGETSSGVIHSSGEISSVGIPSPGKASSSGETLFPDKSDTDLGIEIWANRYGSADARKKALGSRYDSAQNEAKRLGAMNISEFMKELEIYEKKHGALFH